jgi:hypothetical protein
LSKRHKNRGRRKIDPTPVVLFQSEAAGDEGKNNCFAGEEHHRNRPPTTGQIACQCRPRPAALSRRLAAPPCPSRFLRRTATSRPTSDHPSKRRPRLFLLRRRRAHTPTSLSFIPRLRVAHRFRGGPGCPTLSPRSQAWRHQLRQGGRPWRLVVLSAPYLWRWETKERN